MYETVMPWALMPAIVTLCVGILIFGTEFSIEIFDHNGITFLPAYDMFQDTETSICVVRTLA